MAQHDAEPRYPLDRWTTDFRYMLEVVAKLPAEERTPAFESYYTSRYPDDPYSYDNRLRMVHCINYFTNHLAEFSLEHFATWGREVSQISPHLVVALYRLFVSMKNEHLGRDIAVSIVIDIAEEQRNLNPDAEDQN